MSAMNARASRVGLVSKHLIPMRLTDGFAVFASRTGIARMRGGKPFTCNAFNCTFGARHWRMQRICPSQGSGILIAGQ